MNVDIRLQLNNSTALGSIRVSHSEASSTLDDDARGLARPAYTVERTARRERAVDGEAVRIAFEE